MDEPEAERRTVARRRLRVDVASGGRAQDAVQAERADQAQEHADDALAPGRQVLLDARHVRAQGQRDRGRGCGARGVSEAPGGAGAPRRTAASGRERGHARDVIGACARVDGAGGESEPDRGPRHGREWYARNSGIGHWALGIPAPQRMICATLSDANWMEASADVLVVGAGAAGLWAAERAAREGRSVLLLEKTPRTGSKVLASGGTRCNLTTTLEPRAAAALFGKRGARFLDTAFRVLPPRAVRARFAELGVPTVEAPLEKIFPESGRAVDVRDALERAALAAGVRIELDCPVESVVPGADGTWTLAIAGGRTARAPRVILCPGGKSYPRTGTTGDGYRWLDDLGLEEVEPVPALAPLASPRRVGARLAGISLQEGEARLVDASGAVIGRRRRPVLFTHRGLSGPGAMDLSEPVARARAAADRTRTRVELALRIDLAPDLRRALRALLVEAGAKPGGPTLSRVLPIEVPRRVLRGRRAPGGTARARPAREPDRARGARGSSTR